MNDAGGSCPEDTLNIVTLFAEMRAAMPGKIISIASQASRALEQKMDISDLAPHVDRFHVMVRVVVGRCVGLSQRCCTGRFV